MAVATIRAILTIVGHVAIRTVDALRAPLATETEREATATDALAGVACIVHVFGIEDAEAVVAILGSHGLRKITILGPVLDQVVAGFT